MLRMMCLIGILCPSFLQGAARDSDNVSLLEGTRLNLEGCFSILSLRVPCEKEPKTFHEPVFAGCRFQADLFDKWFSLNAKLSTETLIKVCAGFVVGLDEEFTKKTAAHIQNDLTVIKQVPTYLREDVILRAAGHKAALQDQTKKMMLDYMKFNVAEFECADNCGLKTSGYRTEHFVDVEHGIIVPPGTIFESIRYPEHATLRERLDYLKNYTAELCSKASTCQEIPVLIVNRERLEALARALLCDQCKGE